ncbi:MAG: hypothetical protein JWM73_2531 [Solirubrobacterales bacterium]|nr:hypothetical protein [Solirubrobacterales bacterium]
MRRCLVLGLAAVLLTGGVALGAPGQTPPPGQTPAPGQTPGQTGGPNHAPVCPAEAHMRIPMRVQDDWDYVAIANGNCSDEDGDSLTYAVDQFTHFVSLSLSIYEDLEHATRVFMFPLGGWTGTDHLRYHARDGRAVSNTADFSIEVVEGLKAPSAIWIGTARDDVLVGTGIEDDISGQGGDDQLGGGGGADDISGGGGTDTITGGAGNDAIGVRDHHRDVVDCGKGRDSVTADRRDVLRRCERVKRRN